MALADEYGINLGNILSTASDIKTSRLNLENRQKKQDKAEAGERNIMRKLRKGGKIKGTTSLNALNEQSKAEAPVNQNTLNDTQYTEEEARDIALNPTVYNEEQASIKANALKEQMYNINKTTLRMTMPNATPEQIETLSQQESSSLNKTIDMISKGDENVSKQAMMQIDKNARILMSITQAGNGIENPEMKQKAINDSYTEQRDKQIQLGKTEEERASIAASIPATYNPNWVAKKIAESEAVFKFAQEDLKIKSDIKMEETKQSNKLELAKVKANASTGKSKKEFMQIMDILENGDITEDQRGFYEARLTKLSQPDMKSKEVDINTANKLRGEFANKLKLDNPYALSTVDTRKLTPEQQAEANTVGQNLVKLSGANAKEVDKKMANYGSNLEQTQNALDSYTKVGNFRLVDETVKKYISNYTGLSDKEIESTEAAQSLQSLLNISIKADSGSAVSAQEMLRKTLETASVGMNKQRIVLGIKNLAKRNIGELKGLKKVMGQVPFNLRYGGVLRNYEDILKSTKDVDTSAKQKSLEELRAEKTPTEKVVKRTGTDAQGNKVVQYEDGTIERAGE